MGIDVYLKWDGQTKEEEAAQITGFSTTSGAVGYLREAYHGSPYATKILVKEGFEEPYQEGGVVIKNEVLLSRIRKTLLAADERERIVYNHRIPDRDVLKSFEDFVDLHGRLERAGKNPRIVVSY